MRHPGLDGVRVRAAEFLEADFLPGHRLDHVRAGDEHVRGALDHQGEVGDGGGVDGTARARSHDQRDLRDDPGPDHVPVEDLREQAQRDHALLDPRPAAVVDADQRAAGLHRVIHQLDDLLAVHLAQRAAEHGEVLAEHADRAAVDGAVPGDHAVAVGPVGVDAERGGPVPGQFVELGERGRVEQPLDPLPGGHLALGVLALHRPRRAGVNRLVPAALQVGDLAGRGVRGSVVARGVRPGLPGPVLNVAGHADRVAAARAVPGAAAALTAAAGPAVRAGGPADSQGESVELILAATS